MSEAQMRIVYRERGPSQINGLECQAMAVSVTIVTLTAVSTRSPVLIDLVLGPSAAGRRLVVPDAPNQSDARQELRRGRAQRRSPRAP
jgi:hypothetical protein